MQLIRQAALIMVQPPWEIPDVCRDPDDNQILACANAAKSDYVVTGDYDLLVLKEFKNIRITKPRDFELLFKD